MYDKGVKTNTVSTCASLELRDYLVVGLASDRFAEKLFHYDAILPYAVQTRMPMVDSDLPETEFPAQSQAGVVFGEYSRHKLPESHARALLDQFLHHFLSGPTTSSATFGVDGEFSDPRVALTRPVRGCPCNCNDPAMPLENDSRILTASILKVG
jgi:hypothetical protein